MRQNVTDVPAADLLIGREVVPVDRHGELESSLRKVAPSALAEPSHDRLDEGRRQRGRAGQRLDSPAVLEGLSTGLRSTGV